MRVLRCISTSISIQIVMEWGLLVHWHKYLDVVARQTPVGSYDVDAYPTCCHQLLQNKLSTWRCDACNAYSSYPTMSDKTDLTNVTTPKELSDEQCAAVLERLTRKLAGFRNQTEMYATAESWAIHNTESSQTQRDFVIALNAWAQDTLKNIWLACREPGKGTSMPSSFKPNILTESRRQRCPQVGSLL